jgi:hypothetical protein
MEITSMTRVSRWGALLLLVSVLSLPGAARAAESEDALPWIQVGPAIVHPYLSLKETYSDNVYYTEKNTTNDFITTILPSVTLSLPFRMHELSLGASAEFLRYAENTELNVTPYELFVLGDFTIGDRVQVKVGDTYRHAAESPLASPNRAGEMYDDNAAALSVKYAFVDVAQLQLDYTRTMLDYPESAYRTRDEDLVSVFLYYRVLPVTSAFIEYDFKNVAYDTSTENDNVAHNGHLGATWEISEFSKGTAKIGYQEKNYTDASLEDYGTWTASVDLLHQFTDAASARLLGKRDVNEGKDPGVRYYTTSGVYVDFTYRFLDRLAGQLEGSYGVDDYSDPPPDKSLVRKDTTARAGLGAKYSFNGWLDVSAGYAYLKRDSNYAKYDATVNSVNLAVTAHH